MSLWLNALIIVVILVIAFYVIRKKIAAKKANQVKEKDEKAETDDKTYTLNKMIEFVKRRLDEITKVNLYDLGLSEEELKEEK